MLMLNLYPQLTAIQQEHERLDVTLLIMTHMREQPYLEIRYYHLQGCGGMANEKAPVTKISYVSNADVLNLSTRRKH